RVADADCGDSDPRSAVETPGRGPSGDRPTIDRLYRRRVRADEAAGRQPPDPLTGGPGRLAPGPHRLTRGGPDRGDQRDRADYAAADLAGRVAGIGTGGRRKCRAGADGADR